jgi:NAD(P)-dependent dehydrogenase (short-subunit alcohol dehydrogenase family)
VNNVGIHLKKPAVETTTEEFQSVLATHVLAAHALNSAVLPGMLLRSHGVILMTASMAAYMGVPQIIAYTAAKTACVGMTRALAAEVSQRGLIGGRVNREKWLTFPIQTAHRITPEPK